MHRINNRVSFYFSTSRDVTVNLALEETLMADITAGHTIVLFYENDPAVVLGRFQNPWRECRTGLARRMQIPVRRRISGGGTVVHCSGNLNFAVICGKGELDKEENLDRIIEGCSRVGLTLMRSSRYDLLVKGEDGQSYKVSGSAFRQTAKSSLHHGTLLVDANLNLVRSLLKQRPRNIESRSVASEPSPVANISGSQAALDLSSLVDSIAGSWDSGNPVAVLDPSDYEDSPVFQAALERLGSEDWIWRKTPFFRETFVQLPGIGEMTIEVKTGG